MELGIKLHKILTMALTAIGTSKLGVIEKILDSEYIMLELTTSILKVTPMLKSGIVFISRLDKGLVLEYIFKKYNYYPKIVILLDDLIENVESLQQTCFKLNIDFYGFHYKTGSLISLPTIDDDLEKEFIWLHYKKLKKQVNNFYHDKICCRE